MSTSSAPGVGAVRSSRSAGWPDHPELAGIGERGCFDLDLAVDSDVAQLCVDLYRDVLPCGAQTPGDLQRVAMIRRGVCDEADVRVVGDVEEVVCAQVLVALRYLGVHAVGVDGQLDRRAGR
jgi:hypothetical protein